MQSFFKQVFLSKVNHLLVFALIALSAVLVIISSINLAAFDRSPVVIATGKHPAFKTGMVLSASSTNPTSTPYTCVVPTNIFPSGDIGSVSSVMLTWAPSKDAVSYNVRLDDGVNSPVYDDPRIPGRCGPHYYCEDNIDAATYCSDTTCILRNIPVVAGRSYNYWIAPNYPALGASSSCSDGTSFKVASSSAATSTPYTCVVPTNLAPLGDITSANSVSLSWTPSKDAVSYNVRLDDAKAGSIYDDPRFPGHCIGNIYYCEEGISAAAYCSGNTCILPGIPVVPGHSYNFGIDPSYPSPGAASYCSEGVSFNVAAAATPPPAATSTPYTCAAPTNFAPSGNIASTNSVDLTWTPSAGATFYNVRLDDGVNSPVYDDPRFPGRCGPHYYCEDGVGAAIYCSNNHCAIPNIPVVPGRKYNFWIDPVYPVPGASSFCNAGTSFSVGTPSAPTVPRVGQLVQKTGDATIYYVASGGLYGFPDIDTFNSWGFSFSNVVLANSAEQALNQIGIVPMKQAGCNSFLDQLAGICGVSSSSYPPYAGKEIYIFADEATYNALPAKIERLATDIKSDLGTNVIIKHANYASPVEIRNILKQSYAGGALAGSILIGDIPTFSGTNNGKEIIYTDWYYANLNDSCPIDQNGVFEVTLECQTVDAFSKKNVFAGRITPPIKGSAGITMVEYYLDKDHAYRQGEITFPKKLLIYPGMEIININTGQYDQYNKNPLSENIKSAIDSQTRYNQQDVDAITELDFVKAQQEYLAKLQNNRYETALINIHGSATAQLLWKWEDAVTSKDIARVKPNIMFAELLSCNNGAFKELDYFAGELLFNGDTLLVTANSEEAGVNNLVNDPSFEPVFFDPLSFLNSSAPFGELFRHYGGDMVTQFFGDPTLRMVNNKVSSQSLVVEPGAVDFGNVSGGAKTKTITIKNTGQTTSTILISPSWGITIDDKIFNSDGAPYETAYGMGFRGFKLDQSAYTPFKKLALSPGETVPFVFSFSPYVKNGEIVKGRYNDSYLLLTSDNLTPYIDISVSANQQ